MSEPPERVTFSLPPNGELNLDLLDKLVEESDAESRSEYIRRAINNQTDEV